MVRSKTSTWFETKIRVERTQEDGLKKSVMESFTVEAINWTDAEATITGEMAAYGNKFEITDIKKAAYKEIYFSDSPQADKWYKCKVQFITLDEKTMKEKRSNVIYLVQARAEKTSFLCRAQPVFAVGKRSLRVLAVPLLIEVAYMHTIGTCLFVNRERLDSQSLAICNMNVKYEAEEYLPFDLILNFLYAVLFYGYHAGFTVCRP